jgi:UDP-N-acetylglucosamine:LPS N-acetylglucosamine transferase
MSKASIIKNIRKFGYEIAFQAKKHSPTILMFVGATGAAASMVMACKATIKAVDLVKEHKHTVECIHICMEDESIKQEYTEEDAKKELTGTYVQTG